MTPNILFTSDTHFYHKKVIEYSNRPFKDVDEMNATMINNWNAIVRPDDTIYHLGDFAFCSIEKFEKLLDRLNGNLHIITGNHDKVILNNQPRLLAGKKVKSIQQDLEIKYNDYHIVMYHYGGRVWHWSYKGSIQLYGHSHGRLPPYGRSMDVGVDSTVITTEYRPITIKEVIKFMEPRTFGLEADDIRRRESREKAGGAGV